MEFTRTLLPGSKNASLCCKPCIDFFSWSALNMTKQEHERLLNESHTMKRVPLTVCMYCVDTGTDVE